LSSRMAGLLSLGAAGWLVAGLVPLVVAHGGAPVRVGSRAGVRRRAARGWERSSGPALVRACRIISLRTHLNPLRDYGERSIRGHGSAFTAGGGAPFPRCRALGRASRLPIVPAIVNERVFVPNVGNKTESVVTGCNVGRDMRPRGNKGSREGIVLSVSSRVFTVCTLRYCQCETIGIQSSQ
jgi:hypothetical protein